MWKLFLLALNCLVVESKVSYDGYSLMRITPSTKLQLQYILQLNANTSSGLDFWLRTTAVNNSADVMVSPWAKDGHLRELEKRGISYSILHADLGRLIEDDMSAEVTVPAGLEFFSNYQSVEKIQEFMKNLADQYPSLVKMIDIGSSYEGRSLLLLKVFTESEREKPVVWIQGGAHAREMIGPPVVLFLALNVIDNCFKKTGASQLIEKFDWYFYPVVNPDGYEYARTEDRLWRKTRSLNVPGTDCVGADANRNWDFHWSGTLGASTNPCSHNYAGIAPFSEPETRAIAEFMQNELEGRLHIFLDFHSYSQRWLAPWGYTSKLPENYLDQKELADIATSALQRMFGTKYSVGTTGNIMYTVTGGARDWVHGVIGAPFSYVIELRDKGQEGGFLLPRSQILPTAQETLTGVKAMVEKAVQNMNEWDSLGIFGQDVYAERSLTWLP